MRRPLHIDADLDVRSPAGTLRVRGQGGRLTVSLPPALRRGALRWMLSERSRLQALARGLAAVEAPMVVRDGERAVAVLGRDRGRLGRWLGLGPTELRPVALVRAVTRRRAADAAVSEGRAR